MSSDESSPLVHEQVPASGKEEFLTNQIVSIDHLQSIGRETDETKQEQGVNIWFAISPNKKPAISSLGTHIYTSEISSSESGFHHIELKQNLPEGLNDSLDSINFPITFHSHPESVGISSGLYMLPSGQYVEGEAVSFGDITTLAEARMMNREKVNPLNIITSEAITIHVGTTFSGEDRVKDQDVISQAKSRIGSSSKQEGIVQHAYFTNGEFELFDPYNQEDTSAKASFGQNGFLCTRITEKTPYGELIEYYVVTISYDKLQGKDNIVESLAIKSGVSEMMDELGLQEIPHEKNIMRTTLSYYSHESSSK